MFELIYSHPSLFTVIFVLGFYLGFFFHALWMNRS